MVQCRLCRMARHRHIGLAETFHTRGSFVTGCNRRRARSGYKKTVAYQCGMACNRCNRLHPLELGIGRNTSTPTPSGGYARTSRIVREKAVTPGYRLQDRRQPRAARAARCGFPPIRCHDPDRRGLPIAASAASASPAGLSGACSSISSRRPVSGLRSACQIVFAPSRSKPLATRS